MSFSLVYQIGAYDGRGDMENDGKFSLTPEEEDDIIIDSTALARAAEACASSLVGKLLSKRSFSKAALKDTMRKVWGQNEGLKILEVGDNLFHFRFSREADMRRVLNGGPWCFDNMLLLLKKWEVGMKADSVNFHDVDFWIQLWGLPFECISPEIGEMIGNRIGQVLEVRKMADGDEWGRYVRVRIRLPLDRSLRRGGNISLGGGDKCSVDYKYERLPLFCHYCGKLDHEVRECSTKDQDQLRGTVKENEHGSWMAATPSYRRGYNWKGNGGVRPYQKIDRMETPIRQAMLSGNQIAGGGRSNGSEGDGIGKFPKEIDRRESRLDEVDDQALVAINGNQFRMGDLVAGSSRDSNVGKDRAV